MKKMIFVVAAFIIIFGMNILHSKPGSGNSISTDMRVEQDTTGINDKITISAYPNPCDEQLSIKFELEETNYITIKIYNFTGNLMRTVIDGVQYSGDIEHIINFDVSQLANGAYEYTIQSGGDFKVGKFVVQR